MNKPENKVRLPLISPLIDTVRTFVKKRAIVPLVGKDDPQVETLRLQISESLRQLGLHTLVAAISAVVVLGVIYVLDEGEDLRPTKTLKTSATPPPAEPVTAGGDGPEPKKPDWKDDEFIPAQNMKSFLDMTGFQDYYPKMIKEAQEKNLTALGGWSQLILQVDRTEDRNELDSALKSSFFRDTVVNFPGFPPEVLKAWKMLKESGDSKANKFYLVDSLDSEQLTKEMLEESELLQWFREHEVPFFSRHLDQLNISTSIEAVQIPQFGIVKDAHFLRWNEVRGKLVWMAIFDAAAPENTDRSNGQLADIVAGTIDDGRKVWKKERWLPAEQFFMTDLVRASVGVIKDLPEEGGNFEDDVVGILENGAIKYVDAEILPKAPKDQIEKRPIMVETMMYMLARLIFDLGPKEGLNEEKNAVLKNMIAAPDKYFKLKS